MIFQTTKSKWGLYLFLIALILGANYTIYHQPIFFPIDQKIVIASLIDFILVIPLFTYFFIIRKKNSIKTIGIPILGGYAAAHFIIPEELLQSYSQLNWLIITIEILIAALEFFLLYKIVTKFPTLKKEFTKRSNEGMYFIENIGITLNSILPNSPMKKIMNTELSIYYYSLFSYRKKLTRLSNLNLFTYHRKTSAIALNIMLIHAIGIETIGLHYFLHGVSPILSYILLLINVYTILLFLAEIQAIRLSPIQVNDNQLIIQIGIMKRINVPLESIEKIYYYNGPETINKQELGHTFDARINDFIQEKPIFEITLDKPLTAHHLYGFTKKVDRIVFSVDEPDRFIQTLNHSLPKTNTLAH